MSSATVTLAVIAAVLLGVGVYLILERALSRVLLGVVLIGNGINLVVLSGGGAAGGAPVLGVTPVWRMNDPLPQAMVLTAIVITLAVTAFVLAMVHRLWEIDGTDEIQDDVEDLRVVRRAERVDLRAEHRRLRRELRERTAARGEEVRRLAAAARAEYADDRRRLGADADGGGATPEHRARVEAGRRELRERLREIKAQDKAARAELRARFRESRAELNRRARAERAAVARADVLVDEVPDTEFPRGAVPVRRRAGGRGAHPAAESAADRGDGRAHDAADDPEGPSTDHGNEPGR